MSLTLDTTLSGESAESYASVAEADSYHCKRAGHESWAALDTDAKIRALVGATDILERLDYWGSKVVASQALKFPRVYRSASDGTAIPKDVLAACCELAHHVATASTSAASKRRAMLRGQGVVSHKIGDFSETFATTGVSAISGSTGQLSELPPAVQRLMGGWIRTVSASESGRHQSYGSNYDSQGLWWPDELI